MAGTELTIWGVLVVVAALLVLAYRTESFPTGRLPLARVATDR
jgi:hypothetical protein